jgi:glucose/mannose-6-phosphate isomerase
MSENAFWKQVYSLKEQISFGGRFKKVEQDYAGIVISGMGGSGVAGRIFSECFQSKPVYLVDSYELPAFVNENYFFVAISYSGNTEETISVTKQAKERGILIHSITSGGKLVNLSDEVVSVPEGLQPREAVGYLLTPLLNTFTDFLNADKNKIVELLERLEKERSPIWTLAQKIVDSNKIPYIISWEPFRPLSYRFKTQFNENSKLFALNHNLSEQNHNELVPAIMNLSMKKKFFYLVIQGKNESRNRLRMDLIEKEIGEPFHFIIPVGETFYEKLFYTLHYIDILTVEISLKLSYDPEDVKVLEKLKKDLSSSNNI